MSPIRLHRNENAFHDVARWARLVDTASQVDLTCYPDIDNTKLRSALAAHLGVERARIHVGAGSSEILGLIGTAFVRPGRKVVVSSYTFELYRHVASLCRAELVTVASQGYAHDLAAMAACDEQGGVDAIFIDNPCNPTGNYIPVEMLRAFLRNVRPETVVVLDEAYIDFVDTEGERSAASLIYAHPNLVVVRTFSKALGLAGLRVGYGVSNPRQIEALRAASLPFSVGGLAQAIALAALAEPGYVASSVRQVRSERRRYVEATRSTPYGTAVPAANFIFLNMGRDSAEFVAALAKQGIRVRAFDEFPGHVRVSFGSPAANDIVLTVLNRMAGASQ
jgi:histidinol-phosphate aminotransferase